MKITKFLLTALLILFPFGEILRLNIGADIVVKPLDLTAVLLLVCTVIVYWREKSFRSSLKWYFFFFPIVGLLSLGINSMWLKPNELLVSFFYLLRWVAYLSIFFVVIQSDEKYKKKLVSLLIADGIVLLVIGYIQYFFYPGLRNLYYLGWDEHLYRMFSSFLDPNFAGAFFVLYFVFILGLLFFREKKLQRRMFIFYSILLGVTLIAIFLTYSRSALIMLIVSGVTFFLLLQRKKFIFFLLGAIVLFVVIISPFFYIENLDLFRINSSLSRLQTTSNALQVIQKNPIIGVGFDSYRYAQVRYGFIKPTSQFPSHSASGVDTSLLFVVATTGIIGLVSYCYLWLRLFKVAKANMKSNPYAVVFIASTVGLFINALFNNSLFYAEIMLWMWVITGLMYGEKRESDFSTHSVRSKNK